MSFGTPAVIQALAVAAQAQSYGEYRSKFQGSTIAYPQAPCLFLVGGTGAGKTVLSKEVLNWLNASSWYMRAPQEEPENLVGYPMRDVYTMTIGGETHEVGCMRHVPNISALKLYEASRNGKKTGLIVDEIGDCPSRLQAAFHGPLLDNTFGMLEDGTPLIIPNLITVGCFNHPEISTSGSANSHAVATRSCTLQWSMPHEVWSRGMKEGFNTPSFPRISSSWQQTIRAEATMMSQYTDTHETERTASIDEVVSMGIKRYMPTRTPRSWTHAAILAAAARSMEDVDPDTVERLLIAGCVGEASADNYLSWRSDRVLGEPESYLTDTWLTSGEFVERRGDIVAATVSMVTAYYMRNKTPTKYKALARFLERTMELGFDGQAVSEVLHGRLFGKSARPSGGIDKKMLMSMWTRFMPYIDGSQVLSAASHNGTKS